LQEAIGNDADFRLRILLSKLTVLKKRKKLVEPRESHCEPIAKKAGINIITFEKDGAGYRFTGLP